MWLMHKTWLTVSSIILFWLDFRHFAETVLTWHSFKWIIGNQKLFPILFMVVITVAFACCLAVLLLQIHSSLLSIRHRVIVQSVWLDMLKVGLLRCWLYLWALFRVLVPNLVYNLQTNVAEFVDTFLLRRIAIRHSCKGLWICSDNMWVTWWSATSTWWLVCWKLAHIRCRLLLIRFKPRVYLFLIRSRLMHHCHHNRNALIILPR